MSTAPSTAPEPLTGRWALSPRAELAHRSWDGETVVHHALANDTHRLADPAGRVLQALERHGPLDTDALARRCGVPPQDLDDLLAALDELNLLVPC